MTENITEKNIKDQKKYPTRNITIFDQKYNFFLTKILPFSTKNITFLTKNTTIFGQKYNNFRPKIYDFFG